MWVRVGAFGVGQTLVEGARDHGDLNNYLLASDCEQ